MKHDIFNEQLRQIKDNDIQAFTMLVLDLADDKFYNLPASSTGKYHPESSLKHAGLISHTKQVFDIALSMLDTRLPLFDCNRDVVLSACLLHDIYKYDPQTNSRYTLRSHAIKAVEWIKGNKDIQQFMSVYHPAPMWYLKILGAIHSHNGVFSTEYQGSFNTEQSIVHTADYIASRKWCYYAK